MDQQTRMSSSPEEEAEPDQQLLQAASTETRHPPTTAPMSTSSLSGDISQGPALRLLPQWWSLIDTSPTPVEADRFLSPRQAAGSHTANIQPQQAAEQPEISQQLLRAVNAEIRRPPTTARMSTGTRMRRRRRQTLSPDPVLWELYAHEGDDRPVVSQSVTGENPTPAEADRPRSPRRYPQPAEIPRPRPIPPSVRRWIRPPLLSLIAHTSHDSGRPSDQYQPHQHQQRPESPDQ